jgi:glutamate--cysteine ligase
VLIDEPHVEHYIQYLLKVPVIFIVRDKKWIAMDGRTFEKFLEQGYLGFKPIEADWKLFLSSIFTEARLNPFVELRSSDRNSLSLSFGMLALWKGILLDDDAREAAWRLLRDWTFEERVQFCVAAACRALKARLRDYTLKDLALELIHYAEQALKKRWRQKLSQEDESAYLEPVKQLLDEEMSSAEKLLLFWNGSWNRDPKKLVEYCGI